MQGGNLLRRVWLLRSSRCRALSQVAQTSTSDGAETSSSAGDKSHFIAQHLRAVPPKPAYNRSVLRSGNPPNFMVDETLNAGDADGSGMRLWDYQKMAELVNSLPTNQEKIDFVSPYEREWRKPEVTWHRAWMTPLLTPRRAWTLPIVPQYFDSLPFYQYVTKSHVFTGAEGKATVEEYYKGLVLPTEHFSVPVSEALLDTVDWSTRTPKKDGQAAFLTQIADSAVSSLAQHNDSLRHSRLVYNAQNESFWVRSGFQFLYDEIDLGSDKVERRLKYATTFTGDDHRKLGELAFVAKEHLAAALRKNTPLPNVVPRDSELAKKELILPAALYSPQVFNLPVEKGILWQCPTLMADTDEPNPHVHTMWKDASALIDLFKSWSMSRDDPYADECAIAAAVSSLFASLCGQAHLAGHTQYTDVEKPITAQLVMSVYNKFYFAVGQLNTIAINIDCKGFSNPYHNLVWLDGPYTLYDMQSLLESAQLRHVNAAGQLEDGLNPHVLRRILQMVSKK